MTGRLMKMAACLGAAWAVLSCVAVLTAEQRPPKDMEEAQKWFKDGLDPASQKSLAFRANEQGVPYITWSTKNGTTTALMIVWITSIQPAIRQDGLWKVHYTIEGDTFDYWEGSASRDRAERYREAILFLARDAQRKFEATAAAKLESFKAQVEAWRALTEKPKLPDSAYQHKVLAEEAYKNKDLKKAFAEYQAGLAAFPTWPEGQFNDALIAGELQHYRLAVHRMKEYLMLAPDATDAQAAKDKIIIWQDKIAAP